MQGTEADEPTTGESGQPYLFGDLLALARLQWVRRMAGSLAELGYPDYRRSDAVMLRIMTRLEPVAIGVIGTRLGVSRQAARKLVDGLERRGFCVEARDTNDARVVKVSMTATGRDYAASITKVTYQLNRELVERVNFDELVAADAVLRATFGDKAPPMIERLAPPSTESVAAISS